MLEATQCRLQSRIARTLKCYDANYAGDCTVSANVVATNLVLIGAHQNEVGLSEWEMESIEPFTPVRIFSMISFGYRLSMSFRLTGPSFTRLIDAMRLTLLIQILSNGAIELALYMTCILYLTIMHSTLPSR